MKKISVIIPCYNVAPFIDRCMTSIITQTIGIDNLEIICLDDASADSTWEHLVKWEQCYPEHIKLIRHEVNRRQGAARNLGLQYASADWVAFVDADDWLEQDYFEQLYNPVTEYPCDVVACGVLGDTSGSLIYFSEEQRLGGIDRYIEADSEEALREMFEDKILGEGPAAKIIRKGLLTACNIYFPEGVAYEDHYWIPLLYIHTQKAYVVEKKLYHYFSNVNSTCSLRNQYYHIDWITVQLMKWEDYKKRGLWRKYHEIMEGDALYDAAMFVVTLIYQYDDPPFSYFLLESELIKQQVPEYKNNRYAAKFPDPYPLLLKALYTGSDKAVFERLIETIRKAFR